MHLAQAVVAHHGRRLSRGAGFEPPRPLAKRFFPKRGSGTDRDRYRLDRVCEGLRLRLYGTSCSVASLRVPVADSSVLPARSGALALDPSDAANLPTFCRRVGFCGFIVPSIGSEVQEWPELHKWGGSPGIEP